MNKEFSKMSIKGQKGAIILCRTLLNNPQQFDYIKDTFLVKRHGSWQFKDKLVSMLYEVNCGLSDKEKKYLSKQDKKLSNNNKKYILIGITTVAASIVFGFMIGMMMIEGVK